MEAETGRDECLYIKRYCFNVCFAEAFNLALETNDCDYEIYLLLKNKIDNDAYKIYFDIQLHIIRISS